MPFASREFTVSRSCALCSLIWLASMLAGPAAASPWEAEKWRSSNAVMQLYVCSAEHTRASWCAEVERPSLAYRITIYDEAFGPPMPASIGHWYRLIADGDLEQVGPKDVAVIRERAEKHGDPLAMEALGYLTYHGIATARDLASAYVWFAKAFTAGLQSAGINKDLIWKQLVEQNPIAAQRLRERYKLALPTSVPATPDDGVQGLLTGAGAAFAQ